MPESSYHQGNSSYLCCIKWVCKIDSSRARQVELLFSLIVSIFGPKLDIQPLRTCLYCLVCGSECSRKWGNVAGQCAFSAVKADCLFEYISRTVVTRFWGSYSPLFLSPEVTFGVLGPGLYTSLRKSLIIWRKPNRCHQDLLQGTRGCSENKGCLAWNREGLVKRNLALFNYLMEFIEKMEEKVLRSAHL